MNRQGSSCHAPHKVPGAAGPIAKLIFARLWQAQDELACCDVKSNSRVSETPFLELSLKLVEKRVIEVARSRDSKAPWDRYEQ